MSVSILQGDCRERMAELDAESMDSCVTDPPYHLTSIVRRFGAANAAPAKVKQTAACARASKGFMGQQWDGGDVAFQPETWAAPRPKPCAKRTWRGSIAAPKRAALIPRATGGGMDRWFWMGRN